MGFDVGFDAGSSAFEAVEAEEFVSNELKIAWGLEGNEFAEKGNDRGGPGAAMVAAAGFDLKSLAVLEPASSKLVEAGFSYMETLAGFWDSNPAGVEFMKGLQNELACESAGELAFFIAPIDRIQLALGTPDFRSLIGGASPPASSEPPPKSGSMVISHKMQFSTFEPSQFTLEPAGTERLLRGKCARRRKLDTAAGPELCHSNVRTRLQSPFA